MSQSAVCSSSLLHHKRTTHTHTHHTHPVSIATKRSHVIIKQCDFILFCLSYDIKKISKVYKKNLMIQYNHMRTIAYNILFYINSPIKAYILFT